jgi:hypothetical protein
MAGTYDREEQTNSIKARYAHVSTIKDWAQFNSLSWRLKACIAKAAAFAPNPDDPPFYCDFPFVYTDTKPREIVYNGRG